MERRNIGRQLQSSFITKRKQEVHLLNSEHRQGQGEIYLHNLKHKSNDTNEMAMSMGTLRILRLPRQSMDAQIAWIPRLPGTFYLHFVLLLWAKILYLSNKEVPSSTNLSASIVMVGTQVRPLTTSEQDFYNLFLLQFCRLR